MLDLLYFVSDQLFVWLYSHRACTAQRYRWISTHSLTPDKLGSEPSALPEREEIERRERQRSISGGWDSKYIVHRRINHEQHLHTSTFSAQYTRPVSLFAAVHPFHISLSLFLSHFFVCVPRFCFPLISAACICLTSDTVCVCVGQPLPHPCS